MRNWIVALIIAFALMTGISLLTEEPASTTSTFTGGGGGGNGGGGSW